MQAASTAGFTNYNDALFARVRIQVATTQLFFENFANPAAFNRFSSTNFTQVGNQFVASPPKNQKAIATILPAQITPAPRCRRITKSAHGKHDSRSGEI